VVVVVMVALDLHRLSYQGTMAYVRSQVSALELGQENQAWDVGHIVEQAVGRGA